MICGCREVKFLLFAYVNNLLGFLFLFFFFLFQKSNFLAKDCGRVKVGAVIGWLLSHWFNCLFSSQHCLLTSLWPASDCAHCMHANPKRHEPSLALGTAISLISLCLMSETTQSWQVRGKKIPPSATTSLNRFSTRLFIELPKAVRGGPIIIQTTPAPSLLLTVIQGLLIFRWKWENVNWKVSKGR